MHYTLHQLRVFLKVVHLKSITKAAEELHLTQPAVSIQLKKLTEQFEIPLFEVIGKQIYITDFGHQVAASSQYIIDEVHAIKNMTLAHQGLLVGQLKIAIVSTGKYVMPYFLSAFMQRHNGVELKMDVTNKFKVIQNLERNEVDFALVSVLPENLQVKRIELMKNKLFMIGRPHESGEENLLEDIQFIYREKGSATRHAMEKYVTSQNVTRNKTIELTSNEAVKQAVIAGLGKSIMPLIGLKNELTNNELEIIPQKDLPIITHWNLIHLKDKKLSPVAQAYIDFLEAEKENIIAKEFSWYEKY